MTTWAVLVVAQLTQRKASMPKKTTTTHDYEDAPTEIAQAIKESTPIQEAQMPQPEITFRHGLCSASIWESEYTRGEEKFTVRTVSFQRSYLDKEGNWQTTNSLKVNDIPKAQLVLGKAYEFLTSNSFADPGAEAEADGE